MCMAFVFSGGERQRPVSGPVPGVNYVTFGGTVSILLKHWLKNRPGRAWRLTLTAEFYGFINRWFYRELKDIGWPHSQACLSPLLSLAFSVSGEDTQ